MSIELKRILEKLESIENDIELNKRFESIGGLDNVSSDYGIKIIVKGKPENLKQFWLLLRELSVVQHKITAFYGTDYQRLNTEGAYLYQILMKNTKEQK